MIEVVTLATMTVILSCRNVLNQYVLHLKFTQCCTSNIFQFKKTCMVILLLKALNLYFKFSLQNKVQRVLPVNSARLI